MMDGRESSGMSPPEPPGMIVAHNSYPNSSMGIPNSGGMMPRMSLSFNQMPSSGSKPVDSSISLYQGDGMAGVRQGGMLSMGEPMKKKRGRPRKYTPDGTMALALSSNTNCSQMSDPTGKKRGRPRGSGRKKQLEALGSAGISFTPHVITVKAGEDIASKIMAFSQQGPRTVCILSANGAVSNATLRQPATSGGTITYEGRFEIISLSGSFLLTESGGTRSRTGGLSVALAGPNGRILGGGVAGILMAATPVQVVMGSFIAEGKKPKPEQKLEPSAAQPLLMQGFGAPSATSTPSQGTSSESEDDDDDPGSPTMNLSGSGAANPGQHGHGYAAPTYNSISSGWGHYANHQPRHDSDMKMMPN